MQDTKYVLSLKSTDWITSDVTDVDQSALGLDLGVFARHQPAAVGEEETTLGVVRVGVGLRVLVVHAVVAHPVDDRVLWATTQNEAINDDVICLFLGHVWSTHVRISCISPVFIVN